jgi:hypothetical protein
MKTGIHIFIFFISCVVIHYNMMVKFLPNISAGNIKKMGCRDQRRMKQALVVCLIFTFCNHSVS